jgi:acyl-CoA thioesterase FadM
VEFFKNIGFDYFEFEKCGIVSPVVGLNNIKFKRSSTAGDTLEIEVSVKSMTTVIFTIQYVMKKGDIAVLTGESEHCLLSKEGKIVPLNDKRIEALSAKLASLIPNEQ